VGAKYKAESFDLWQFLCGKCHVYEPFIRCRIDLAGHIDVGTLKRAVTLSKKTLPMIGCCFQDRTLRPVWVDKNFTGDDIVRAAEVGDDAESRILEHLFSVIDVAKEPPLRITVVTGAGGDTLCALVSHILCDTAGLKQYLYLLSGLYTKLKRGERLPEQTFEVRGTGPLFAGIGIKEKVSILRSEFVPPAAFGSQAQPGISFGGEGFGTYLEKRVLPIGALKTFVKKNGATVNDGLMALYARAFCKNTGANDMFLPSTVDLRKFIPKGVKYGISNYSGDCMCRVSVGPGDPFEKTVRQFSEQMAVYKTGKRMLKNVLRWERAVRLIPYPMMWRIFADRVMRQAIITYTNLGVIESEELKFEGAQVTSAYLTASIKARPYLLVNASTFRDCCTLSSSIYGSEADREFVVRLLEDMRDEAAGLA